MAPVATSWKRRTERSVAELRSRPARFAARSAWAGDSDASAAAANHRSSMAVSSTCLEIPEELDIGAAACVQVVIGEAAGTGLAFQAPRAAHHHREAEA